MHEYESAVSIIRLLTSSFPALASLQLGVLLLSLKHKQTGYNDAGQTVGLCTSYNIPVLHPVPSAVCVQTNITLSHTSCPSAKPNSISHTHLVILLALIYLPKTCSASDYCGQTARLMQDQPETLTFTFHHGCLLTHQTFQQLFSN